MLNFFFFSLCPASAFLTLSSADPSVVALLSAVDRLNLARSASFLSWAVSLGLDDAPPVRLGAVFLTAAATSLPTSLRMAPGAGDSMPSMGGGGAEPEPCIILFCLAAAALALFFSRALAFSRSLLSSLFLQVSLSSRASFCFTFLMPSSLGGGACHCPCFAVALISAALRFLWACRRSSAVSFLAFVVVLFAVAVAVAVAAALTATVAWLSSMTFSASFASSSLILAAWACNLVLA
mmetsp:Transcript_4355/g.8175  ORF Transcript_4355/g.8175 Transcript_4355/m.8175 type:complete len:237 (-) Transcript_4355:1024-1734(-)